MTRSWLPVTLCGLMLYAPSARAYVVISSGTTSNMNCSGGVCEPTASDAVLNVSDLENMLASGNVTVTTTGSGVQANNIDLEAPLSWSTQSSLALDASRSIAIDKEISIAGQSGLSLATNGETQSLTFGRKGRIAFQNLSSQLAINGTAYTLVNDIASLASAIASNPSGTFAFADNYNASGDGTYPEAPVSTAFKGSFEGLGNTISRLSINHTGSRTGVGLFYYVVQPGVVAHVRLAHADITGTSTGEGDVIGTLAALVSGAYFFQDSASGTIRLKGRIGVAGGLVGSVASSTIDTCFADVAIDAQKAKSGAEVGGLVADNGATITSSFASGAITVGKSSRAGGLVGGNPGPIENSYSTGAVSGSGSARIGGLTGTNKSYAVSAVYSTGAVSGGSRSYVGGFAGENGPSLTDVYWDTDTSGTIQAVGRGNKKGITGLTTQQLQSGLPQGFDPNVWGEKASINGGLPYLIGNPPPK